MSENSALVSKKSVKRRKVGEKLGNLCSWGNLIVASQQNAVNQIVVWTVHELWCSRARSLRSSYNLPVLRSYGNSFFMHDIHGQFGLINAHFVRHMPAVSPRKQGRIVVPPCPEAWKRLRAPRKNKCNIDFILVLLTSVLRYVVHRNRNFSLQQKFRRPKWWEKISLYWAVRARAQRLQPHWPHRWSGRAEKSAEIFFRSVSGTGTRPDAHRSRIPAVAVAMIGWHVARHWPAGDGGKASVVKMASTFKRLVLWRYRFSSFLELEA